MHRTTVAVGGGPLKDGKVANPEIPPRHHFGPIGIVRLDALPLYQAKTVTVFHPGGIKKVGIRRGVGAIHIHIMLRGSPSILITSPCRIAGRGHPPFDTPYPADCGGTVAARCIGILTMTGRPYTCCSCCGFNVAELFYRDGRRYEKDNNGKKPHSSSWRNRDAHSWSFFTILAKN